MAKLWSSSRNRVYPERKFSERRLFIRFEMISGVLSNPYFISQENIDRGDVAFGRLLQIDLGKRCQLVEDNCGLPVFQMESSSQRDERLSKSGKVLR